jgi:hypothetical protein
MNSLSLNLRLRLSGYGLISLCLHICAPTRIASDDRPLILCRFRWAMPHRTPPP